MEELGLFGWIIILIVVILTAPFIALFELIWGET